METNVKNILDMDAVGLREELDAGRLTSLEITQNYIDHLKNINPSVNCLVEERFETALKEAAEADEKLKKREPAGKLTGIPISMKEAFDVEGMHTTGGLVLRKDRLADKDAEVVAKLRKEGAIILGKTNTPALCFCQETDNKLFGRTNNPWDLKRTAGGSSGGEGALIASGGAAAGIGSDIGGSIRFPSHFNGVVGFKSGNGRVSDKGSYPPINDVLQERMLGIGPMTKSVRDARFLYEIMAEYPNNRDQNLEDFTIHCPIATNYPLGEDTRKVLLQIKDKLSGDLQVDEEIPPYLDQSALLWQEIMSIDGARGTAKEAGINGTGQLLNFYLKEKMTGKSGQHGYLTWALIGAGLFKPGKKRMEAIKAELLEGDQVLEEYLAKGIVILPVYHRTAPLHGDLYKEIFSINKTFKKYMPYTAFANVWGLPALTIPVGKDCDGMPIGVQLISRNGNEEVLFQMGERMEGVVSGYERRPVQSKVETVGT